MLQERADAGERAARADGADEAVDLAVGLLPDLGPRARRVAVAVRVVVPLVRVQHAVLLGRLELLRRACSDVHVVVRVLVRHGGHLAELGAAQAERVLLLLRLRVRHQDQRAIAARLADERQADAGIAGRAFDDEAAGLDDAAALAVEHHVLRRSILDRAARVHELGFAEDRAARELGGLPQLDERRVADGVDEVVADVHPSDESYCVTVIVIFSERTGG